MVEVVDVRECEVVDVMECEVVDVMECLRVCREASVGSP